MVQLTHITEKSVYMLSKSLAGQANASWLQKLLDYHVGV